MNKVLHSSKKTGGSDDWATPQDILDRVTAFFGMGWQDPCPLNCDLSKYDTLKTDWKALAYYINPPYSQLKKFIQHGIKQLDEHSQQIWLIPARTDTQAFALISQHNPTIVFICGRITFVGGKYPAPFPSMLVYFGKDEQGFVDNFGDLGHVYTIF